MRNVFFYIIVCLTFSCSNNMEPRKRQTIDDSLGVFSVKKPIELESNLISDSINFFFEGYFERDTIEIFTKNELLVQDVISTDVTINYAAEYILKKDTFLLKLNGVEYEILPIAPVVRIEWREGSIYIEYSRKFPMYK